MKWLAPPALARLVCFDILLFSDLTKSGRKREQKEESQMVSSILGRRFRRDVGRAPEAFCIPYELCPKPCHLVNA
jgi:hypothetical protein